MSKQDELIQHLKQERDELKLKLHLASKELKDEWEELEGKWDKFSSQAGLSKTAAGVESALELLGDELKKGYERLRKAL